MERTHTSPEDVALQRLIEQPSYGAQVLVVTARMLEMDAAEPMTRLAYERALDIAADAVVGQLPEAVSEDTLDRVYRVRPPIHAVTRGEYALRLRAAAKELG